MISGSYLVRIAIVNRKSLGQRQLKVIAGLQSLDGFKLRLHRASFIAYDFLQPSKLGGDS
jgi:hypothetical protein